MLNVRPRRRVRRRPNVPPAGPMRAPRAAEPTKVRTRQSSMGPTRRLRNVAAALQVRDERVAAPPGATAVDELFAEYELSSISNSTWTKNICVVELMQS